MMSANQRRGTEDAAFAFLFEDGRQWLGAVGPDR